MMFQNSINDTNPVNFTFKADDSLLSIQQENILSFDNLNPDYDMDKFGFYTVGNYKTYSKLDAILMQEKTNNFPIWHFNNDVFSSFDWKIEPKEDLQELYRQRAQQLRDKYDYLVLFYSGGADSTQILQTFINNDIKLDEIAQFYTYEGDKGNQDSAFNAEITRVAIPWSLKIIDKYKYMKHRVIDQTQLAEQMYDLPEVKFDFIFQQNCYMSPTNFARSYLRKFVKEYQDMISKGIKVGFIWGSEKPKLNKKDNRWYFYFQDVIDNCVSPIIQQMKFPGWYDELFYWSPDFTKGLIKQAHLIKNSLETIPFNGVNFTRKQYPFGFIERSGNRWYLTNDGLHSILYPGWDISTFSVGKPKSSLVSPRDYWYFDRHKNENTRFHDGIDKLDLILNRVNTGFWKNDARDLFAGIKGCISVPYFLE